MRTPPAADTTTVIHTPHTETKPNESSLNFKPKPTEFDNQLETPQINSPTQNHSTQNEMDLETRDFIAKAEQAALDFRAMIWAPPLPPAADTTTVIHTPHTETKPNESSLNFKPKPTEFAPGLSDDVTTISARGDTLIDDTTIADSKPSEEELKKLESMFVNSRCWGFCVFCCMSVLVCMCVCVCACVHVCCMYVMV
eukprot:GHVQ01016777.1.p1 GENE.GHVQ01016777.1~~GHVQ01016777.1.p1  ORF type:complete len:197 (+),score=23.07 GHVQ01016777.1:30-620(+)